MSSLPKPIANLIHDLRERRMLPLVVLLLLAIVAVPFLLSEGADEPAESGYGVGSADVTEIEGAEIAEPVVLAEVPGIRNFRKRLADFKKQNPFKQQLTGIPAAAREAQEDEIAGAQDVVDDAAGALDPVGGAGGGAGGTNTDDTGATGTPGSTGGGSDSGGGQPEVKEFAISWEIDVKAGPVGDAKRKEGLKELSFVPGDRHPVLQFIQGAGGDSAIFVVSRSVGDTYGDGACAPQKNDCQFLLLKVGQARTFEYEPNGERYKVKLTGVDRVKREITDQEDFSNFGDFGR